MKNNIGDIIRDEYKAVAGKNVAESEVRAWSNSLQYIDRVLNDNDIPADSNISIEYHLPRCSRRIDFIIAGVSAEGEESVIIIELKQWQQVELTDKDGIVSTRFKGGIGDTPHPSYQAWSYKKTLEDYSETVEEEKIRLIPCAYLHNYEDDGIISNFFYQNYIKQAPLFLKSDALKLREFIKQHIKYGDKNNIMFKIDNGKIRPSKNLADELVSLLAGNDVFVMIDSQKVVYETALQLAERSSESR